MNAPLAGVWHHVHRLVAAEHDPATTDRELLERFVSGQDEDAFAALLRRHGAMVLGVCRRELRHAQDAEDACQATFLVLARRAASVRKREALGSWLHGVAVRVARNLRRGALRRSVREGLVADVPQPDALAELTWREVQVALDEELGRLPERFRSPLVLCCLEGKSRDEAARQLGWSLGVLKGRLERGRELLRARLTRRGVTLSAACLAATLAPGVLAAVPGRLAVPTVKAAKLLAAGKAVPAGLIPTQVLSLAETTAKALWLTKVMALIAPAFALALAGTGAGWFALGGKEAETGGVASSPAPPPRTAGQPNKAPRGEEPIAARPDDLLPAPPRHEVPRVEDARRPTEKPVRARSQDEQVEAARREPRRGPLHFLDLQPHANQKLKEGFDANGINQSNNLASLPTGEQALAGVTFNIGEGLILLNGRGEPRPEQVKGIRVGATCSKLHILHATQWDAEKKDTVVGYYRVNYEDKCQETIPIVYGRDVNNWWHTDCKGPSGAEIAWKGSNEAAKNTRGATLRLYVTRWKNPEPARKVVSIDFASTNSDVTPFCVAMTVEE